MASGEYAKVPAAPPDPAAPNVVAEANPPPR